MNDITKAVPLKRRITADLANFIRSSTRATRLMVTNEASYLKGLQDELDYRFKNGDTFLVDDECVIIHRGSNEAWYVSSIMEPVNTQFRTEYLIDAVHLHYTNLTFH